MPDVRQFNECFFRFFDNEKIFGGIEKINIFIW